MSSFTDYFLNIQPSTLEVLEAMFVAKVSPANFILMDTKKREQPKMDKFVAERAKSVTRNNLKSAQLYVQQTPQILQRQQALRAGQARATSAPSYGVKKQSLKEANDEQLAVKSIRALNYPDFLSAMFQILQIPSHISMQVFAKLCKPAPNSKHKLYNQVMETQDQELLASAVAKAIFIGCYIAWADVLTFVSNKTDLTKQQTAVKLVAKRTPTSFSHRMNVEQMGFISELGAIYSTSKDGMIHLWADQHPDERLRFHLIDDQQFGFSDQDLQSITNEWHRIQDDPKKRTTRIEVVSRIVRGEIPLSIVPPREESHKVFQPIPFQVVWSFGNPDNEPSLAHIMRATGLEQNNSKLIEALRAADAPLPSGRPLPERVTRTPQYGRVIGQGANKWINYEDYKTKTRRQTMQEMDDMTFRSSKNKFDNKQSARPKSFYGVSHPLTTMTKAPPERRSDVQQKRASNLIRRQTKGEKDKQLLDLRQREDELPPEATSLWATNMVFCSNMIYLGMITGKIAQYRITQTGIALTKAIMTSGIGMKSFQLWKRELNIFETKGKHIVGCNDEDLPVSGKSTIIQPLFVFTTFDQIGFVRTDNFEEIAVISISKLIGPQGKDENQRHITILCTSGRYLFVATSVGIVLQLDGITLQLVNSLKVSEHEITSMTWNETHQLLVIGSLNSEVSFYNFDHKLQFLHRIRESGAVTRMFTSTKFGLLITLCAGGIVSIWSLRQYNQLFKLCTGVKYTGAAWDETNGFLLLGSVQLRLFQLVGAKEEEVGEAFPQAHTLEVRVGCPVENLQYHDSGAELGLSTASQTTERRAISTVQQVTQPILPEREYVKPRFRRQNVNLGIHLATRVQTQPNIDETKTGVSFVEYSREPEIRVEISRAGSCAARSAMEVDNKCKFAGVRFDASQQLEQTVGIDMSRANRHELMESLVQTQQFEAHSDKGSKGYLTIDIDGNVRFWNPEHTVNSQFKLEITSPVQFLSVNYEKNIVAVGLANGDCIIFETVTFQVLRKVSASNCAKAAYLLQFKGQTYDPEKGKEYTSEFQEHLRNYNPKRFERINSMVFFLDTVAVACGNYVMLFDLQAARLSQHFVDLLLKQNSREAISLSRDISLPPKLVLQGHESSVVAIHAIGRKMLTCDEEGYVCCWQGQGIAKGSTRIEKEYIEHAWALEQPGFWGLLYLRSGLFVVLDKQLRQIPLLSFELNASPVRVAMHPLQDDAIRVAACQGTCAFVFQYNLNSAGAPQILGYFKLQCECKQITMLSFANGGSNLILGDQSGHCFCVAFDQQDGLLGRIDYTKKNQVTATKNEQQVLEAGQLQLLFNYNSLQRSLVLNPDFDEKFDSPGLLKATALRVREEKKVSTSEMNNATQKFFDSIRPVELFTGQDYDPIKGSAVITGLESVPIDSRIIYFESQRAISAFVGRQ